MQEQEVAQTSHENVPKGTNDADVWRYGNKDVAGTNHAALESAEQIYRSIFGDAS